MSYIYSIVTESTSDTPGEVLQVGTAGDAAEADALALEFPDAVAIGTWPGIGQDAYWLFGPSAWYNRPERPGPTYVWNYGPRVWVDSRTLTDRRDEQWALIKAAQVLADALDFTWSGSSFQADTSSRDRIREALIDSILATLASESWSVDWTLADNSVLTMSASDFSAMSRALAARTQANQEKAQAKRLAIYASSTPEDITWDSIE